MNNYLVNLFQQIQKAIATYCPSTLSKKVGRTSKVSDLQLSALYILSYLTNTPVLNLARLLIDSSIQSWHLFRKSRTKRIYQLLREYMQKRVLAIIFVKLVLGKRVKLIVDGTIEVEFEELYYGVLVMVLCDEDGVVMDMQKV
ncbi:hypothetical protein [Thermocrinis sp.]